MRKDFPPAYRRALLALLGVVTLLATLLALGAADSTAASPRGIVNGNITCPKLTRCPNVKLQWFDERWSYLGSKKANGGGYSLTLPAGVYWLQFVDQRPAYDTSKYAPINVKVRVRANDLTTRNLTMQRGASLTGVALGGNGKPLRNARVVAARTDETSFATQANGKGQFALGGLPAGKYSVFTFDAQKTWVGKSTWAGGLQAGQSKNLSLRLRTKAGSLTVYLFQPEGLLRTKTTLTVTSKATGQWWTASSGSGTFVFRGVYPGAYRAQFGGAGVWFAKTGSVEKANVRSGRMGFGDFHLTKRGGWVTGQLADGGAASPTPLKPPYSGAGAQVKLLNSKGETLATATSGDDGKFKLTGQLATQAGLTIVVNPSPNAGGWMNGEGYCQFLSADFTGYGLTTGRETSVGQLAVPRKPGSQNPACAVASGRTTR